MTNSIQKPLSTGLSFKLKFVLSILLFTLSLSSPLYASFSKTLWPLWEMNNPLSKSVIEHKQWQYFLDNYMVTNAEGINLIEYPKIKKSDIQNLKIYIESMARIPINDYNRSEQLAYWINLYNAVTVFTVATHYPVGSIDEINTSPGLFSVGPWAAKLVTVNGIPLSLDDIQNRIIRPIWNDARTHYALNNGSIGAPNLGKEAYRSDLLESQLNQAAFKYINSLRGIQVIEGKLIVSKLYEWYEEDFGGSKKNIIIHIEQFAKEPLKSQLKHINSIDNTLYNWHLNSTIPKHYSPHTGINHL